ncbi:hypothetical protein [Eisenibacter elegans]|jgi:hypothetical protein|uniref:hypothetical protein n=1 Tax=Eisenibacter elegans TaxID=997 RepID=UPI0004255AF9|nr:hypothetical protein [Eisenibacter elegans]
MLEYVKTILQKVSFDKNLFEKELRKSIARYLETEEVDELRKWCYGQFSHSQDHVKILNECFAWAA